MTLRLNLQTASALIAGLLLLLAVIGAVWSDAVLLPLGRMTYQGEPLVRVVASVPDIGPFESFNVNNQNPFIPFHMRDPEARKIDDRAKAIAAGGSGRKPVRPPTSGVTVVPPPTAPPVLKYPRLPGRPADAPRAMGMIGTEANIVLLVRQADGSGATPVPIGGTCNGWTLMAVEGGNQAVWEDPSGTRHTFPVGSGTLAEAQELATGGGEAKDQGKAADGTKKDGEAKVPEVKKVDVKPDGKKDPRNKGADGTGKTGAALPEGRPPRRVRPPPDAPMVR